MRPLHSRPHPVGVQASFGELLMASESPYGGPPGPHDRQDEVRGLESFQGHPGSSSSSSYGPPSHSRHQGNPGAAKLFVGQIPAACTEDDLHHLFSPYGALLEVVIFRSKSGSEKAGYGFITFSRRDEADAAINALHLKVPMPKGTTLLQVKFADGEAVSASEPKLFVGNLTPEVVDTDLLRIFSPFGEIVEVVVLRHLDGTPKGSGFVRFRSLDSAHAAIDALHNRQDLHGRTLSISIAETPRDKQQRRRAPMTGGRSQPLAPYDRNAPYNRNGPPQAYHGPPQDYGPPPSYYAPPPPHMSYSPSNFESVIQGIESQIAAGQPPIHVPIDAYAPYAAPPAYHTPPPAHYPPGPPPSHYLPPPQMAPPHQGDSLLSMMMPRPGAPSHGNYLLDNSMRSALGSKQEGPRDSNLFILHIPKEWRNEDLYTAFIPYGRIVSANIFLDKETGESKCFGFVSFDNPHSAMTAVSAMNGQQVGNKRIKVELKRQ